MSIPYNNPFILWFKLSSRSLFIPLIKNCPANISFIPEYVCHGGFTPVGTGTRLNSLTSKFHNVNVKYFSFPDEEDLPQGEGRKEVDKMLEWTKEATRKGKYVHLEYARFADDLVILVDGFRKWDGLVKAVYQRLL